MKTRRSLFRFATLAAISASLVAGCGPATPQALVASAKEYLAKNDRSAAVVQLKTALQKDPDNAEARFLLGKALLETGDVVSAQKELQRAAELKYPADQIAPALARAVFAASGPDKVIADFGNAATASPEARADLQTTLGQAYSNKENVDAALAAFAAAKAAVPGYPPALLGEARLKVGHGDVPGATALVEAAIARSPNFVDAWQLKGDLLAAQGRTDDALAAYRKALQIRPTYLAAHGQIVYLLIHKRRNAEAAKQLEAMTKIAPKHPYTYYFTALVALADKRYRDAREAIQLQLRAWPDNVPGLVLEARIDSQLGSYGQAEAALQKVLQPMPQHRPARMALVQLYLRTGQRARALETLRPLLQAADDDSDVQALAGEVFMQNGDTSQAARAFTKAAALDPQNVNKRTAAAMARVAAGDAEKGVHDLQEVAAVDSGNRADLALIAISTSQRKFDEALDALAALEKKQPNQPFVHDVRGSVLVAKGDRAAARKSFEQALALDPTDFTAASSLARLDVAEHKPDDAKKRYEAILAKDPKNARALLALADLRAQNGATPDEVVALIGNAVRADPTDTGPRLALISHYMRTKEPKKAVAAAQDALAAMPDRPELLYAAGEAQRAAGEPNQAAQSYNKLAASRPGATLPYMKEAEAQFASRNYDAAVQSLKKALAITPDLLEAQRALIAAYMAQGKADDALAVARTVQKQRPAEPVGYVFEGDIYAYKKQWNEAANAYRRGLPHAAGPDLAARTDAALRSAGKAADADKFAVSWVRSHPQDREFRRYLGESAIMRGDYAGAVREFKAILELKPDDALALNNLAWASGQLKDPKAIDYAQKANATVPNNAAILDTLGTLQVEKGDMKNGIASLQRASTLAPNAPGIRLNFARALVKDGQKDAAKKELQELAKLGDKFSGQAEVTKLMQGL